MYIYYILYITHNIIHMDKVEARFFKSQKRKPMV